MKKKATHPNKMIALLMDVGKKASPEHAATLTLIPPKPMETEAHKQVRNAIRGGGVDE